MFFSHAEVLLRRVCAPPCPGTVAAWDRLRCITRAPTAHCAVAYLLCGTWLRPCVCKVLMSYSTVQLAHRQCCHRCERASGFEPCVSDFVQPVSVGRVNVAAVPVQVHKMKTDTEAAMIELDKIMKANELTLAVTAAFPAIVVAGTLGYAGWRLISPPPPNVRTTAGPIRVAMAELERVRTPTSSIRAHDTSCCSATAAEPGFSTVRKVPWQVQRSVKRPVRTGPDRTGTHVLSHPSLDPHADEHKNVKVGPVACGLSAALRVSAGGDNPLSQ